MHAYKHVCGYRDGHDTASQSCDDNLLCMYVFIHVCVCVCIHVYMYVCKYVFIHACVCVCTHVYMYVCKYVGIRIDGRDTASQPRDQKERQYR
jgi:hypothetical protein